MGRRTKPIPQSEPGLFFRESEAPTSPIAQRVKAEPNGLKSELLGNNAPIADDDDDLYDDDEEATSNTFFIQESLPTPTSTHRKLEFLLELLENSLIDLNPEYQREVVWTQDRQVGLINSLNENFYIPPVIFNIEERPVADSEGTRFVRVCVDGKQRLSSVLRFVQGLIPCVDGEGYKWWWNRVGGRGRNLLDDQFKSRFLSRQLICIEYSNLSDKQQEDLFGRVQMGMVLSEAEKLKAQKGPWQDFALDCEEDFKDVVSLAHNQRASGFRNILAVMAQVTELETVDTKMDRRAVDTPALQANAPSLKKFVKNEGDKCTNENINRIAWIFQLWDKIRQNEPEIFQNNNYKVARKFSPIEFLTVGMLLYRYGHNRTLTMLRGDIVALRLWLRRRNLDLRTNAKCWRDCWEFLEHLVALRGESGPWTDHGITPHWRPGGGGGTAGASGSGGQNGTPRKITKSKANTAGTSAGKAKPKATPKTAANVNSAPPAKGKKGGTHAHNAPAASSSVIPATAPRIPKTKTSLPHHPPPPKGPIPVSTMRSSSSSPAASSDDEPPRPTHPRRVPQAPMTIDSSSASNAKRKRLPITTADGARQMLFKRKRHADSE